jgi:2-polyprenyl-3-methyl-5-hydroxy-6-metoxy-1,4-benzoquinol methylase
MSRPLPIPPPDRHQIGPLNEGYLLDQGASQDASLKSRLLDPLRRIIQRAVAPRFHRQQHFNAILVDHLNRTDLRAQQAHAASEEALLWTETSLHELTDRLEAADDILRHREALAAREARATTAVERLTAAHDQLQSAVGLLQVATQSLARDLARKSTASTEPAKAAALKRSGGDPTTEVPPSRDGGYKYVGFEERFRGSEEDIRQRQLDYVSLFAGATDVLDVGCGRGEFLALLAEHGITARGIDVNQTMVDVSLGKGLTVVAGDALEYLRSLPDHSLGGLLAAQVVEHFEPPYLNAFAEAAFAKLRPGSTIVLETINPACWYAFFSSYIRDYTHTQPLHPDTLAFLMTASGFQQVALRYLSPVADTQKLQQLATLPGTPLADVVEVLNANVDHLNSLLFSCQDYAAVGRRP